MPLERHNLVDEFPEMREKIRRLKQSDAHFARLYGEYETVNHDVFCIESGAEAASDERLEKLKKKRLKLVDTLFLILHENKK